MTTKGKRPPRPALAPDQYDTAHALYLRHGATPRWVAAHLTPPVDWRTVQAAVHGLGWDLEKLLLEKARTLRAKRGAEEQIALEVEQDEHHAALARREMELRERLVEKAHMAVDGMTPAEAVRALGKVASFKDTQFVERLARNRATERVADDAAENLRALSEKMLAALAKKAQGEPPDGAAPAAAAVAVAPAPPAKPNGGNGHGKGG
jgi:hypothetical protein